MRIAERIAIRCVVLVAVMVTGCGGESSSQSSLTPSVPSTPPPIYDPSPPGILPADIDSEIARVQSEITGLFNEALVQWMSLPPPFVTGNPPTLQGDGSQLVQTLGKLMNFDLNMSPFK